MSPAQSSISSQTDRLSCSFQSAPGIARAQRVPVSIGQAGSVLTLAQTEIGNGSVDPATLFTEDVDGWSPYAAVSGLTEAAELATLREMAFSNVVILFRGVDEVGNKAFAEWVIEADHSGPYVLSDAILEPTGRRIKLAGVTVADFRDGKIRSFRTYFDDMSLIEQLIAG